MKNISDVTLLRKNYRIVGSFIGTNPETPHQNEDLGLPLLLMAEEATLLVEMKVAVIVEYEVEVNEEVQQFYDKLKNDFYKQYSQRFKEERKEAILSMSDKIIAGKIEKFREQHKNMDQTKLEEEIIRQEMSRIPDITPETCVTQIHTNCPFDKRSENVIDLRYPKTTKELIRYRVFKDLWLKNYYITEGIKFGSDFLVYETDPIGVHSKYMVICREEDKELTDLEIQTYGRLGKSVRKTVLIAINRYLQQNDNQIEYKTIEWKTN